MYAFSISRVHPRTGSCPANHLPLSTSKTSPLLATTRRKRARRADFWEKKRTELRERAAAIGEQLEDEEYAEGRGVAGAAEKAETLRAELRELRERIQRAGSYRSHAQGHLGAARAKAARGEQEEGEDLVLCDTQYLANCAIDVATEFDATLRALGELVGRLSPVYRELLRRRAIHGVEFSRFHSSHAVRGAIHAAGNADLPKFLDIPLMPPDQRRPLAERERRKWGAVLERPTKNAARLRRIAAADPALIQEIEAAIYVRDRSRLCDADEDTDLQINAKSHRVNKLIVEQLDALGV